MSIKRIVERDKEMAIETKSLERVSMLNFIKQKHLLAIMIILIQDRLDLPCQCAVIGDGEWIYLRPSEPECSATGRSVTISSDGFITSKSMELLSKHVTIIHGVDSLPVPFPVPSVP
jgi:hypothetical protein